MAEYQQATAIGNGGSVIQRRAFGSTRNHTAAVAAVAVVAATVPVTGYCGCCC